MGARNCLKVIRVEYEGGVLKPLGSVTPRRARSIEWRRNR